MADGTQLYCGLYYDGLMRSNDSGRTWPDTLIYDQGVYAALVYQGALYAATANSGLLRSHDNGKTWPDTLVRGEMNYIIPSGQDLLTGAYSRGAFFSSDGGNQWTNVLQGGTSSIIAYRNNEIFTNIDLTLYHSTTNGATWDSTGQVGSGPYALAFVGDRLFLAHGLQTNMSYTTDSGATWHNAAVGLPVGLNYIHRFSVIGSTLIGGSNIGAFATTDQGATWAPLGSGLPDPYIYTLSPAFGYLYAGGDTAIERLPLSSIPMASIAVSAHGLSSLSAYPNPCSNESAIEFSTETGGSYELRLVNELGVDVSPPAIIETTSGLNRYEWKRAAGIPSGIYRCILRSVRSGDTQSLGIVAQ
jgi:photosystem II stability/assembly factor-like uncharacterized protein